MVRPIPKEGNLDIHFMNIFQPIKPTDITVQKYNAAALMYIIYLYIYMFSDELVMSMMQ